MGHVNSRNKGNKAERIAAKLVSTWTNRKFERTPSSGGLQWKASFSKGDIVCTVDKHYCPFCFEIKSHKEIDFSHLLNPKVNNIKILKFWAQCKRDADKCDKVPVLMMRYNGMPVNFFFLVIPMRFYIKLPKTERRRMTAMSYYCKGEENLIFLKSSGFFKTDYKEIRLLAKAYLKNGQI